MSVSKPTPSAPNTVVPPPPSPTMPDSDMENNDTERPTNVNEDTQLPLEMNEPYDAVNNRSDHPPGTDVSHTTPLKPTPHTITSGSGSPTPTPEQKPISNALNRELKKIGDFNHPGMKENSPPPSRTRSGKRFVS